MSEAAALDILVFYPLRSADIDSDATLINLIYLKAEGRPTRPRKGLHAEGMDLSMLGGESPYTLHHG